MLSFVSKQTWQEAAVRGRGLVGMGSEPVVVEEDTLARGCESQV